MSGGFPISDGDGSSDQANVIPAGSAATSTKKRLAMNLAIPSTDPDEVGAVRSFQENDAGTVTGTPNLTSPECDDDFRLRAALDTVLDTENFNYTAQNTGKHNFGNTTLAATWNQGGFLTNSGSVTTTTTGLRIRTYGCFPLHGTRRTYVEQFISFSASVPTNTRIDFGLFLDNAANPFAPSDGVYFSFQDGAIAGICNFNGSTTASGAITFTPTTNTKYKFTISVSQNDCEFWINDVLYLTVPKEAANGQVFASVSLPWALRHSIVGGAAGAVIQVQCSGYFVSVGGGGPASMDPGIQSNGPYGSYQGGSGGTMGSQANYANNTNPTAAVPTNTTAALGVGLGGQFWETDTLAANTDGILMSYQVPVAAVSINARRLAIYGVRCDAYVQTVLGAGAGYNAQLSIAFGHTALALNTAESATNKAPRRKALGSHSVAATAAALTQLTTIERRWSKPIIVNPGEYVAIAKKKVGAAPASGVIAWMIDFDYEWI